MLSFNFNYKNPFLTPELNVAKCSLRKLFFFFSLICFSAGIILWRVCWENNDPIPLRNSRGWDTNDYHFFNFTFMVSPGVKKSFEAIRIVFWRRRGPILQFNIHRLTLINQYFFFTLQTKYCLGECFLLQTDVNQNGKISCLNLIASLFYKSSYTSDTMWYVYKSSLRMFFDSFNRNPGVFMRLICMCVL